VEFSTIEVLVAMPMTQWVFRIVPCLAGGNASATCLKMLVIRLHSMIKAQYKCQVIIINIIIIIITYLYIRLSVTVALNKVTTKSINQKSIIR